MPHQIAAYEKTLYSDAFSEYLRSERVSLELKPWVTPSVVLVYWIGPIQASKNVLGRTTGF